MFASPREAPVLFLEGIWGRREAREDEGKDLFKASYYKMRGRGGLEVWDDIHRRFDDCTRHINELVPTVPAYAIK